MPKAKRCARAAVSPIRSEDSRAELVPEATRACQDEAQIAGDCVAPPGPQSLQIEGEFLAPGDMNAPTAQQIESSATES